MKLILLTFVLALSVSALAGSSDKMKKFNEKLMQDIHEVISENPQLYETKEIYKRKGRGPASVTPMNLDQDRLDEMSDRSRSKNNF